MSTTTTAAPVWINNNGMVTCGAHAGHYLRVAIEARPEQVVHDTPIETWFRDDAPEPRCEACRYSAPSLVSDEGGTPNSAVNRRIAALLALRGGAR